MEWAFCVFKNPLKIVEEKYGLLWCPQITLNKSQQVFYIQGKATDETVKYHNNLLKKGANYMKSTIHITIYSR